jgi:hypothetical protein
MRRLCVLPILTGSVLLGAALPARACEPVSFSRGVQFSSRSSLASSFAAPGCFGIPSFAGPAYGFRSSGFSRSAPFAFAEDFEEDFFEEDFAEDFALEEEAFEQEAYEVAALRGGFGLRSRSGFRSGRSFPFFRGRPRQSSFDFNLNLRLQQRSWPRILFRGRSHCW